MPLFILINAKDTPIKELKKPLSFTKQALDSIDKEIKKIFGNNDSITPDYN